jgi:broad specificity phosphatase PhoE
MTMELLIVRHGESLGNLEGRMQGRLDRGLTERGRAQAEQLATWLAERAIGWDAAYCSPLGRSAQTAEILTRQAGLPAATVEPDLAEIHAGKIEGLNEAEIGELHPSFLSRGVENLGDFSEYGGESYDDVQLRVERLFETLLQRHHARSERALLVGHGGINFQLIKRLVCRPVPRVCILRMGNCAATLIQLRERRGTTMGEIAWHVPLELMGGRSADGSSALFR